MRPLYRLATAAYHGAVHLAALAGNDRARHWVAGRRRPWPEVPPGRPLLWMHVASLGEFEQGRPVLELLRRRHPDHFVLLTFFSPSGYERRHDTALADAVAYLPHDTPATARRWVRHLDPALAVFVKYDFWYYHLRELHARGTPTYLIAGSFRPGQPFFRPYGRWYRRVLHFFTRLIVQTPRDRELLLGAGLPPDRVTVGGDPRMDRTLELAAQPFTDPVLAAFTAGHPTLIAGSVWQPDVAALAGAWPTLPPDWRLLLAPHQLHEPELERWAGRFGAVRYSRSDPGEAAGARVLLLDTIGLLSRAYRYGALAYVGGAFRSGLHNTLEPLAYGLPVVFGPRYRKFPEATMALARGGAFSVASAAELNAVLNRLARDDGGRRSAGAAQRELARALRGSARRTAEKVVL